MGRRGGTLNTFSIRNSSRKSSAEAGRLAGSLAKQRLTNCANSGVTFRSIATRDKQQLVRSASLQALAQIGQNEATCSPKVIAAMIAALGNREHEEPVVRQSALDGLAALEGKVGDQRGDVIRALIGALTDRNPRLARKAKETLDRVYKATPAEIEKVRSSAAN